MPPKGTSRFDREYTCFTESKSTSKVDREAGVVRGIKLMGFESKNGRSYQAPDPALFEGKKTRIDHFAQENDPNPPDPKVGTNWGWVENVSVTDDGVFGDLKFNPKHQMTEQILWFAENKPEMLGFSPIMYGTKTSVGGNEVRTIRLVESVDLVDRPATTRSMFESEQESRMDPEMQKLIEANATVKIENETLKRQLAERDAKILETEGKLVASQEALRLAQVAGKREKMLVEAKIEGADPRFVEAVKVAKTDEDAKALIETVLAGRNTIVAAGGNPANATGGDGAKTVESVKDAKDKGLLVY